MPPHGRPESFLPEDGDEYCFWRRTPLRLLSWLCIKQRKPCGNAMLSRTRILEERDIFLRSWNRSASTGEALGEPELCLVTDNKCPAATAALRELGAELWNEEYMMEYNTAADSSEDGKSASHASLPNREAGRSGWQKAGYELDMDIRPIPEGLLICARRPGDHPSPDKDGRTSQDRDDITARNKAHSTARSKVHSTAQDNTSGTRHARRTPALPAVFPSNTHRRIPVQHRLVLRLGADAEGRESPTSSRSA